MIIWNSSLETGNAVVDHEHQVLFAQFNALEDALKTDTTKEELGPLIAFLIQYVRTHFTHEEGIMQTVQCPAAGQNCTAHRAFIGKLSAWLARLNTGGPTTSLGVEIHREMTVWFQEHIVKVDCQLRGCQPA